MKNVERRLYVLDTENASGQSDDVAIVSHAFSVLDEPLDPEQTFREEMRGKLDFWSRSVVPGGRAR